jgi:hypothetical protein
MCFPNYGVRCVPVVTFDYNDPVHHLSVWHRKDSQTDQEIDNYTNKLVPAQFKMKLAKRGV